MTKLATMIAKCWGSRNPKTVGTPNDRTNLNALRNLTRELDSLVVEGTDAHSVLHYQTRKGSVESYALFTDADVAIARTFISAGTEFETHQHNNEREWIGVITGRIKFRHEDRIGQPDEFVDLRQYEYVYLQPNRPHSAVALEDTWFWAISMPHAKGFPNGDT